MTLVWENEKFRGLDILIDCPQTRGNAGWWIPLMSLVWENGEFHGLDKLIGCPQTRKKLDFATDDWWNWMISDVKGIASLVLLL